MITMWHGCRLAAWEKCVEQGYLLHNRTNCSPVVYLAKDLEEAMCYGEVVLEVHFEPDIDTPNNHRPDCWQCRVYKGIPLDRVRVLTKTNDRIGACVNACAGIADPSAIPELLDASKKAIEILNSGGDEFGGTVGDAIHVLCRALAKLKGGA